MLDEVQELISHLPPTTRALLVFFLTLYNLLALFFFQTHNYWAKHSEANRVHLDQVYHIPLKNLACA